jgi:hypothetical protein
LDFRSLLAWQSNYGLTLAVLVLFGASVAAQTKKPQSDSIQDLTPSLEVNWLYGAYVPKEASLKPLTSHQRFHLYLRQTFTTPGIYAKTALFSLSDQLNESPPDWGNGFGGFVRRFGSRQGQFVLQNSFTALGNGVLGYEPRYNRCRCSGFWRRTGHAISRNFITYDRSEKNVRPQVPLYGGAFAAGVVAGTWKPSDRNLVAEGYRGVITQAAFGLVANWIGEFAPDILAAIRGKKRRNGPSAGFTEIQIPIAAEPAATGHDER